MRRLLFPALALAITCGPAPGDRPAPARPAPPAQETIHRWARELGDDRFAVREAAERALLEVGPTAAPAVHEAARARDLEKRLRAQRVARGLVDRSAAALEALGASVQRDAKGVVRVVAFDRERPSKLTDAALVHLLAFPHLENLFLERTAVTDAGLAHVSRRRGLKRLYLANTRVTDDGLKHLAGLTDLESLVLDGTSVKGPGLAQLKSLKRLEDISLIGSRVTDEGLEAGLAGLMGMSNLRSLAFHSTAIGDKALAHLARLRGPLVLHLNNTRVTVGGLEKLKKLPRLRLLHICGREMRLAEALADLRLTAPPEIAIIAEIDRPGGLVLYERRLVGDHYIGDFAPDTEGKRQFLLRPVTTRVHVRYAIAPGTVFDTEGKPVPPAEAWKRLAVGTAVLLGADGKAVDASYLRIVKKGTLVFVTPPPPPQAE